MNASRKPAWHRGTDLASMGVKRPAAKGRVIDLSRAAARHLDMTDDGTAKVRIERQPDRDTDNETADAR
jgi:hypothetical protein